MKHVLFLPSMVTAGRLARRLPSVIDSGPHLFLSGEYYYRQLGQLSLNLCVARTITEAGWLEYLEGSLAISRKSGSVPRVSLAAFAHVHPSATQRRATAVFIEREKVPPIERIAVLTDNQLLRGAMTAFGWVMPKSRIRAFKETGDGEALTWLRETAEFDVARARAVWLEASVQLRQHKR